MALAARGDRESPPPGRWGAPGRNRDRDSESMNRWNDFVADAMSADIARGIAALQPFVQLC
jgi:hypothetical protein